MNLDRLNWWNKGMVYEDSGKYVSYEDAVKHAKDFALWTELAVWRYRNASIHELYDRYMDEKGKEEHK